MAVGGFVGAALALSHFVKEAWGTIIYDTKRMCAAFTLITFEATVHQISFANCDKILLDLHSKNHGKMYFGSCVLWHALRNRF